MKKSASKKNKIKSPRFLIAALVLLALVAAAVLFHDFYHRESYQSVISKFNTAMREGNANEVLALESPAYRNLIRSDTTAQKKIPKEYGVIITDNFYTLEEHLYVLSGKIDNGILDFSSQSLAGARIKTGTYLSRSDIKGVSETFDTRTNDYGAPPYSPLFTVDVIPHGNSWLVDNVGDHEYSDED